MNGTMKPKYFRTELRFKSKAQRNAIKAIARKNRRTMNGEIVIALDKHISSYKDFPITPSV